MITSVWHNITTTPSWVYGIFLFILLVAIQATRPIVIPVKRLFYFPAFFITLSIIAILYAFPLTLSNTSAWLLALFIGTLLGWYQLKALKVKGIKHRQEIYLPGTWRLLVLVIFFIGLSFYINYFNFSINPAIIHQPKYHSYFMAAYGLLTGLFAGRILQAYYCINFGPFIDYDQIKKPLP